MGIEDCILNIVYLWKSLRSINLYKINGIPSIFNFQFSMPNLQSQIAIIETKS